jgi:aryl-alcohol dehydrogenase-like predicted oxidoreductase
MTGGNFIDASDMCSGGTSDEWLGEIIQASKARDEIVLASKFSFSAQPGNPNAGGNGSKNILRALEGSAVALGHRLHRPVHHAYMGDRFTPVEEVASTLNDLVRCGKIRRLGRASRARTVPRSMG